MYAAITRYRDRASHDSTVQCNVVQECAISHNVIARSDMIVMICHDMSCPACPAWRSMACHRMALHEHSIGMTCTAMSCHVVPSRLPSYPVVPFRIQSRPIASCRILYPIASLRIPSHPVASSQIVSYPLAYPIASHRILPSYRFPSYPIALSYRVPSSRAKGPRGEIDSRRRGRAARIV